MWIVLQMLLPLLLSLITKLLARANSKEGLSDKERRRIDTVIARALQIRSLGIRMGCAEEGFDSEGYV